jgi:hypothetical protein
MVRPVMAKAQKKPKGTKRERRERRFLPRATTSPVIVYGVGALGAAAMGAGAWAQWGRVMVLNVSDPLKFGVWLLAAAAGLLAISIWIGTSGEPPLRVGDGGVGVEKNGVTRMPWHQIEAVSFDGAQGALLVRGRAESGESMNVRVRVASQPQAAAWIVREGRARVAGVVDVGEQAILPSAREEAGEIVKLEPLQVVGKRCAASGTVIAFEPDARACSQCERVYHHAHVPEECACGASLTALRDGPKSDGSAEATSEAGEVEASSPA